VIRPAGSLFLRHQPSRRHNKGISNDVYLGTSQTIHMRTTAFVKQLLLLLLLHCFYTTQAQTIPTEKEIFGFTIGDDYKLANYTQTEKYFKAIAAASDRVKLVDIGATEEGRRQYMMIVSSPENMRRLEEYKAISQQLARAENTSDEEAKALAEKGKAIVWIDGGIHATEVVGTHQLIKTITEFVNRKDPETLRILDNVIILFTHINPDGQELVSNWYMRNADSSKRNAEVPRLYQKYIGHDNNRDYYMMNMKETQNVSRQLFIEWLPQIMYNHHQTGPAGSVVAGPPYRDPFNYVYDPLVITGIESIGAAMQNRLNQEGKPGFTKRAGSVYSTWWNGGLRTTPYFHNMIGLLTEMIGSPTPSQVPLVPDRLIPSDANPNPIHPQKWFFKNSMDYSLSLNYAVLDYAARQRSLLLYNIYQMGKNAIAKGSADNWTNYPRYADSVYALYQRDSAAKAVPRSTGANAASIPAVYYDKVFKNDAYKDARYYVIPIDQPDFATATRFINALLWSGIKVMKAAADFMVGEKEYRAGSYVVSTAQAFRAHVLDMFEPQDHPNDLEYPGGPPVRPYDAAGWTLAYQMGVQFDRYTTTINGNFAAIPYGEIQAFVPAPFAGRGKAFSIPASQNNAFIVVNDLLKAGIEVKRTSLASNGAAAGDFIVPATGKAMGIVETAARKWGLQVKPLSTLPAALVSIKPARIGIWNTYGGSMTAGWLQWLTEQYHFTDVRFVYSKEIDQGALDKKFDIIVFNGSAIPAVGQEKLPTSAWSAKPKEADLPEEYKSWVGVLTTSKSVPVLRQFIENGGTVITLGGSANLAYQLSLPVEDHLTEFNKDGKKAPLPSTRFYIPGSILQEHIDSTQLSNFGMSSQSAIYFANNPVFSIHVGATDITALSWFSTDKPLRSGWAWGQSYLRNGVSSFEARVKKGKLVVFGHDVVFRGQSHAGFKRLFNNFYLYR